MTKKELLGIAVGLGSVVVTLLFYAGIGEKLLFELVALGTVAVSMVSKAEKLKDSQGKAKASKLVHIAAMVIMSGCFLWEAGIL